MSDHELDVLIGIEVVDSDMRILLPPDAEDLIGKPLADGLNSFEVENNGVELLKPKEQSSGLRSRNV
ncbi:MAG TPA: hypothetical protein VNN76_11965 [Bacteroidota bacterium]|nr:hypothetical protein [Bacteroidota bacterium]